jgi:hypothetical protein
LLDQNGAGVEQAQALPLRVLLRFGTRLRGDDGNIQPAAAASPSWGGEQRALDNVRVVGGRGRRAGELRYALCHAEACPPAMTPARSAM